jgi:hypothetical protein
VSRRARDQLAPGVVKVRILGAQPDLDVLASVLERLAVTVGMEVLDRDGPHANRRDPGGRVYLTVRIGTGGTR